MSATPVDEAAADALRTHRSPSNDRTDLAALSVTVAVCFAASEYVYLVSNRWGATVSGDSFYYIAAAREFIAGHGLRYPDGHGRFTPLTHFPPLFPLAIAALGKLLGTDPWPAARYLNASLLGMNAFALAMLLNKYGRTIRWAIPAAAALFASNSDVLKLHSWAMSEPLFTLLILLATWGLCGFVSALSAKSLFGAGCLVGLACVDRYIGLSYIGAGVILVGVHPKVRGYPRWRYLALFVVPAATPFFANSWRNYVLYGKATNRAFQFHPPRLYEVVSGLVLTVSDWVVPASLPLPVRAVVGVTALALVAVLLAAFWSSRSRGSGCTASSLPLDLKLSPLVPVLAVCFGCYYGFLLVSRTFMDGANPLGGRMFVPMLPLLLTLVLVVARAVIRPGIGRQIAAAAWVSLIVISTARALLWGHAVYRDGQLGWGSPQWRDDRVFTWIKAQSTQFRICTNDFQAVYFWTGQSVDQVASSDDELALQADRFRTEPAIFVFFPADRDNAFVVHPKPQSEIVKLFQLEECARFPTAVMYSKR